MTTTALNRKLREVKKKISYYDAYITTQESNELTVKHF